jgi:hypothetical protein
MKMASGVCAFPDVCVAIDLLGDGDESHQYRVARLLVGMSHSLRTPVCLA